MGFGAPGEAQLFQRDTFLFFLLSFYVFNFVFVPHVSSKKFFWTLLGWLPDASGCFSTSFKAALQQARLGCRICQGAPIQALKTFESRFKQSLIARCVRVLLYLKQL